MTPDEHWALWHADPRATPFQSPAWLENWWTHLGGGERRDVELRDDANGLIGALPLFVWDDQGVRKLVPVGAGHSDYCDVLLAPGVDISALWDAILVQAETCDAVLLPDLREDSPLLMPPPSGWTAQDEAMETCPVLSLPKQGPLLPALSRTQRRKVVHDRHRAERLGGVEEHLAAAGEINEALDALFALHAARWAAAGETGVLADANVQAFHRAFAPALAQAGVLRLSLVRHEGRIVAVLYGFADASRWHSYVIGIDMTVPGQSFGTLAFATLIEAAAGADAREFHFLRGEEPYKYMWGAVARQTVRRTLRRG